MKRIKAIKLFGIISVIITVSSLITAIATKNSWFISGFLFGILMIILYSELHDNYVNGLTNEHWNMTEEETLFMDTVEEHNYCVRVDSAL